MTFMTSAAPWTMACRSSTRCQSARTGGSTPPQEVHTIGWCQPPRIRCSENIATRGFQTLACLRTNSWRCQTRNCSHHSGKVPRSTSASPAWRERLPRMRIEIELDHPHPLMGSLSGRWEPCSRRTTLCRTTLSVYLLRIDKSPSNSIHHHRSSPDSNHMSGNQSAHRRIRRRCFLMRLRTMLFGRNNSRSPVSGCSTVMSRPGSRRAECRLTRFAGMLGCSRCISLLWWSTKRPLLFLLTERGV